MFILFSSTAKPRYTQDALNVIAYPERSILHFRYERTLVPKPLWDRARRWSRDRDIFRRLSGKCDALFVLVLPDAADANPTPESRANRPLLPLRFGIIVGMQIDGSVLHVHFRLRGFAVHTCHAEALSSALERFTEIRCKNAPWITTKGAVDSAFIVEEDAIAVRREIAEPKRAARGDIWESQVKFLRRHAPFKRTVFFRLERLRSHGVLDHRIIAPFFTEHFLTGLSSSWPVEVLRHESGFQIKKASMHTLKIVSFQGGSSHADIYPTGKGETLGALKLELDDSYFVSPVNKIEILSDYDTHLVTLFPVFSSERALTRLTISSEDLDPAATSPRISLPLQITHPIRTLIWGSLWASLGLVMQMFSSPAAVDWLKQHPQVLGGLSRDLLAIFGGTVASILFMIAVVVVLRRAPSASFK